MNTGKSSATSKFHQKKTGIPVKYDPETVMSEPDWKGSFNDFTERVLVENSTIEWAAPVDIASESIV